MKKMIMNGVSLGVGSNIIGSMSKDVPSNVSKGLNAGMSIASVGMYGDGLRVMKKSLDQL